MCHCVSEMLFPSVKEFILKYETKRPLNVFQSVWGEIKQSKKVLLSVFIMHLHDLVIKSIICSWGLFIRLLIIELF